MDFGTKTLENKRILHSLAELFNNQIGCDFEFTLKGNKTIGAHQSILTAGSRVFAAMFQSVPREAQTRREDIDMDVLVQLLAYLYSGNAPKLCCEQLAQPLYDAAARFGVEPLKQDCIVALVKRLNVENTLELLVWWHQRFIPKLVQSTINVIALNGRKLCTSPQL